MLDNAAIDGPLRENEGWMHFSHFFLLWIGHPKLCCLDLWPVASSAHWRGQEICWPSGCVSVLNILDPPGLPLPDVSWIAITNSYIVSCEVPCVEWANIYLLLTTCQAFFAALYLTSSSQHLSYPGCTGKARIHTQVFGLFQPPFVFASPFF